MSHIFPRTPGAPAGPARSYDRPLACRSRLTESCSRSRGKRPRTPLILALLFALPALAQPTYPDLLAQFPYRNLGPFRAGAWVDSIAVAGKTRTFYAAVRTGGVWKTTNNGITFENVTDTVGLNSIGAVAVAPSDPNIVWVGSGDNTLTRSAYYGNGVYKSADAGATWQRRCCCSARLQTDS